MAFQNNLARHVKSLEFVPDEQHWKIVFVDNEGTERTSVIEVVPAVGLNDAHMLQFIIGNYCVNNSEDSNLWLPTAPLRSVVVTRIEALDEYAIHICFENGLEFTALHEGVVGDIDVIENLVVHGINYYNKQAGCKFNDITVDGLEENVRAVRMFENTETPFGVTLLLQDHAHLPVSDEQINDSVSHYLDAAMMLSGMYNTQIVAYGVASANFIPDQFRLPKFEIRSEPWFKPTLIAQAGMSATLLNSANELLVAISE